MRSTSNILLFALSVVCSKIAVGQWTSNTAVNTLVCSQTNDQYDARIVSDTKKGAIISWVDHRNSTYSADIFAQRLDKNGIAQWTANGKSVCSDTARQAAVALCESGTGGAIMVWQDWRSGDRDIYAQKVDSTGNMLWTSNGVAVCAKSTHQQNPKIVSDGSGGAIIVWEDSISGSWDIYAQHVNSAGVNQWTAGGVIICNAIDNQINPKIISDGSGGAIIAWQDKRNTVEYHIFSQRINSAGAVQWTANGVMICSMGGGQTNPKIEMDGSGGAYLFWQDKRTGTYDVYGQRLNSAGALQWTSNGVAICTASGAQSAIDVTTDLVNGAIVSWKDARTAVYQIFANMISPAGVIQWTTNGIALGNGINPNMVGDHSGGAIITWQDSTAASNWNVYSQRLDAAGNKLWGSSPLPIATALGGQSSPKNVSTGDGGSIYCWQDKRNTVDLDIFAHHIAANGTFSGIQEISGVTASSECYPNPFTDQAVIHIATAIPDPSSWTLRIYDLSGKLVKTTHDISHTLIEIERSGMENGLYLYSIENNKQLITYGKFTLQ